MNQLIPIFSFCLFFVLGCNDALGPSVEPIDAETEPADTTVVQVP